MPKSIVALALVLAILGVSIAQLPRLKHPRQISEESLESQIAAVKEGRRDRIELVATKINDEQIAQIESIAGLKMLILDAGALTDRSGPLLAKLHDLETLRVRHSRLSDETLVLLSQSPKLDTLNIPHGRFGDAGVEAIVQANRLSSFRFHGDAVTQRGVAALARMTSLRRLHLIDVPIDDAALATIAELPKLENLYIDGGEISPAAWDAFFKRRPEVHVHVDQNHHDLDPASRKHKH